MSAHQDETLLSEGISGSGHFPASQESAVEEKKVKGAREGGQSGRLEGGSVVESEVRKVLSSGLS